MFVGGSAARVRKLMLVLDALPVEAFPAALENRREILNYWAVNAALPNMRRPSAQVISTSTHCVPLVFGLIV